MNEQDKLRITGYKITAAAGAAWLIYLAIDFFLHAVIFAHWWKTTEKYWRSPQELFRFIPFAYASFAIFCLVLTWLFVRIYRDRRTFGAACRFGAISGLVFGISIIFANYSVFRMPASALLVWPAAFLIGSPAACAVANWVLNAERPWRRVGLIFGITVLFIIVSVVFQNLFYPTNSSSVFEKG
jgi:hypothetical protein